MKTCTFKKALSLLIAVMMVASCLTVLSVNAAAVKWDRFATVDEAIAKTGSVEWIPIGGESGNGQYVGDVHSDDCNNDCTAIYGFAQDSTKIYVFIETTDYADKVTLRLDTKRDTLVARSHELVFEWNGTEFEQTKFEYGTDAEDDNSVTSGKFSDKLADFYGTAFVKGNSYDYATKAITKAHTGMEAAERTGRLLVVQLRKDRLQGNAGSGNFDYVSELGFDIEVLHGNGCAINSSNSSKDLSKDATDFNLYSLKEDKVVRIDLDGKISPYEFWKENKWQLVTGANGQLIMPADIDQTDIAYEFQVTGDNVNIYIAAKLYGESYKNGDTASSFKVYLNSDEENAMKGGLEPTAVLEFVFDGSQYVYVGGESYYRNLQTATSIAADGHAEIEIKLPYRDLLLYTPDFKKGDPYNYLGVNFEFTAPALYTNEQTLVTLVGKTYGKDADHPSKNCAKSNYYTFNSNYAKYYLSQYAVDRYAAADYNNNLAFECGEVSNFSELDMLIRELSDDYAANRQIVVNRVSTALKTGEFQSDPAKASDTTNKSFFNSYFDYMMYSDGADLYIVAKGYNPIYKSANAVGSQTYSNYFRVFFSDPSATTWTNLIDATINNKDTNELKVADRKTGKANLNEEFSASSFKDYANILAGKISLADTKIAEDATKLSYDVIYGFYTNKDNNGVAIGDFVQLHSGRYTMILGSTPWSSNRAYREISIEPATKLVRKSYVADETLKKNVLADVEYSILGGYLYDDAYTSGKMHNTAYSAGYNYYDYRIEPSLSELQGVAVRGYLNDGKMGYSNYGSKHEDRTFAALKNNSTGVFGADATNAVSFKLLRNYDLAAFKAVFTTNLGEAGVGAPNYVDVYVSNGNDTQRVGRYYAYPSAVGTVEYDITLNNAVVGNEVIFKFDNTSSIIFAVEFQAYAYGDLIVTTKNANAANDGYDPATIFGQNANNINNIQWWNAGAPVFKYDTNLGAYYRVSETVPAYGAGSVGNYKKGDFAITVHNNLVNNVNNKATAAQKANLALLNSIVVGERVYLYNDAHADANYDLMMQPTNSNFYITIGNALMSKDVAAYNPTVGYKYTITDLGQIGDGKSTMILIDSQSVPTNTAFKALGSHSTFTVHNFGDYVGNTTAVLARIGNAITVGEVSAITYGDAKDYNYFYAVAVDNNNRVVETNYTLGRPDGVKTDMVIPEGGYIVLCNANLTEAANFKKIALGDNVALNNVNLDVLTAMGTKQDLSGASFYVYDGDLPVDSFTVGSLLNSNINLWNYNVAIVEYDEAAKNYYVANYMAPITRASGTSDAAWKTQQDNNNAAKRALSFTTQGFAIVSLNGGELFSRLSRMWANVYNGTKADIDVPKTPDIVYLYDVDLDALRLSYGNAGALNAKVTFNNKNGKDNVTTTESWVDLAEVSLNDLTNRWMKDIEALKSQVALGKLSQKAYDEIRAQVVSNLTYARAFGVLTNSFNNHDNTAGLRANPWVLYDGTTEAANLSFDENIFAFYNRNYSIFSEDATQTAGIMLVNTDKNYEAKTEISEYNKNFPVLHTAYAQRNYINKVTYTFYYDFANSYSVPETLRIYTSNNYSFMNHTKPNTEVTLKDKTSDDGKAYPTSGNGTWTITVDVPLTTATAIYTEFDFTSKQLGVVEINERCVITDLMTSEINSVNVAKTSCSVTVSNNPYPALTSSVNDGVVTVNHTHKNHTASGHVCTTECVATISNQFYGNTFVDLEATPNLHIVMDVPSNLSAPSFKLEVYYNGTLRYIDLTNIISREVVNGKIDYYFDFADFCKNTYGMTLKSGELLQLNKWVFTTKFADTKDSVLKISTLEFIDNGSIKSNLVAGSGIKLDEAKKLLILDQQYKEEALKQQFNGAIAVEGTAKSGFVGTGATVTVNGTKYTVVLYGDLNGDGALNPADYIMIRRAILKSIELDDIQNIAAVGPKASKITATSYIQIRQHVLGTYNFFKGEKIAQ